jgi:hypothetical protein
MPLYLPLTRIEKNINHVRFRTNGRNPGPKKGMNEREALCFELLDLMRGMMVVAILLLAVVAGLRLEADLVPGTRAPMVVDKDKAGKEEYKCSWGRRKKERAFIGENIWKRTRPR